MEPVIILPAWARWFVAAAGCKLTREKKVETTAAAVTFHKNVVPVLSFPLNSLA